MSENGLIHIKYKLTCWYCGDECSDNWCSTACKYIFKNNSSKHVLFVPYFFPPFILLSTSTKEWFYRNKHKIKQGIHYNTNTMEIFVDNVATGVRMEWKRSSKQCLLCYAPGAKHKFNEIGNFCDSLCISLVLNDSAHHLFSRTISGYKIPYHSQLTKEDIQACVRFMRTNISIKGILFIKSTTSDGCMLSQRFNNNNYYAYISEIVKQLKEKQPLEG